MIHFISVFSSCLLHSSPLTCCLPFMLTVAAWIRQKPCGRQTTEKLRYYILFPCSNFPCALLCGRVLQSQSLRKSNITMKYSDEKAGALN